MAAKFEEFPTAEHDEAHAERLRRLIGKQRTHAAAENKAMPQAATGNKPATVGMQKRTPDDGLTQSERFIKAAQELGTDDDPERFKERVRKLAKADRSSS